ncbi:GNAT family N-acetyltransferase, partial [Streptomyces goshikiensis]|uniref:GNAT family N-acetyltransferase n=1 Tax=Streptomyces goshikiensis TaxID=1942 RepID=UPI003D9F9660
RRGNASSPRGLRSPGPSRSKSLRCPKSGVRAREAELSYMLLPEAWGHGYALEACSAALSWFADAFPGEPVVLCTQVANDRSVRVAEKLGFSETERFEECGAEQWFGVWSSVPRFG